MFVIPKSSVFQNLTILAIALLIAFIATPLGSIYYDISIDHSLRWLYNHLWAHQPETLAGLRFPHGPLAFLQYPLPMGSNYLSAFVVQFLIHCTGIFTALQLCRMYSLSVPALLLITVFILSLGGGWYLSVIALLLAGKDKNLFYTTIPASLIVALGLYVRAYLGISLAVLYGAYVIYQSIKHNRLYFITLLYPIIFLIFIWVWLFGSLNEFAGFWRGFFQLSLGNSVAVALYPHNNLLLWGAAFLLAVPVFYYGFKKGNGALTFALIALVLITVKYAFSRQDYGHLSALYEMLLISFLLMLLFLQKRIYLNIAFAVAAVWFFLLAAKYSNGINRFHHTSFTPVQNIQNLLSDDYSRKLYRKNWLQYGNKLRLQPKHQELLGNKPVALYPWNYLIAGENNLAIQPQPVPHAYAGYNPYLDEQDSLFFSSNKAPEFLIIHPGSYHQFRDPLGVDDNYLWNCEPRAARSLLLNYRPDIRSANYIIYKKRDAGKISPSQTIAKSTVKWNQWIAVPAHDQSLWMKGSIGKSWKGHLKSALLKSAGVFVEYRLINGLVRRYRVNPANLKNGYLASPLHNPLSGEAYNVEAIRFQSIHPADYQQQWQMRFMAEYPEFGKVKNTEFEPLWQSRQTPLKMKPGARGKIYCPYIPVKYC